MLRLILWIESHIKAIWRFLPGIMNPVGDGCSRNPPDRDKVRAETEGKDTMPTTLAEAFEQAKNSAGAYLGELDEETVHSCRLTFREPLPLEWNLLLEPQDSRAVCVRPVSVSAAKTTVALFAPGFGDEHEEGDLSLTHI